MSKFDDLLNELSEAETLAKALGSDAGDDLDDPNDDAAIAAAAEDGDGKPEVDENGEPVKKKDEAEEGEELGKSFKVTLENGEEAEAIDGTELVKSLMAKADATDEALTKALRLTIDKLNTVGGELTKANAKAAEQDKLIKSLTGKVEALGETGRGRKSALDVHEKETALQKGGEPEGLSPKEFLIKADAAFTGKRITGTELSTIEAALNRGQPPREDLIQKVMNG
ncbi:MAG TPA: hypothetical protein VFL54_01635 [Gammaproteobacteria bacterium]|nr:hypothetical protein [Gammaproteobacteria bacterium]